MYNQDILVPALDPGKANFVGERLRCKLLIVDDEADLRMLLTMLLEDAGFETEEAADGTDALYKLGNGRFDLVLLDYRMPGKNGVQVYQDIRAAGSDVPVILVTAMNGVAAIAAENGIALFLEKPFGIDELLAIIKRTGLAGRAS